MTNWGRECPRCRHVERNSKGPGQLSTPKCPDCNWPMNSINLDLRDNIDLGVKQ